MDRSKQERPRTRAKEGGVSSSAPGNEPHYFPGDDEKNIDDILANAKSAMQAAGCFGGEKQTYVVIPGRGTYPLSPNTTLVDLDEVDRQSVAEGMNVLRALNLTRGEVWRVVHFAKSLQGNT